MRKQYVTYVRFLENIQYMRDPTKEFGHKWNPSRFVECPLVGTGDDARLVGYIELDESHDNEKLINRLLGEFAHHGFVLKTPEEVLELSNEWYGEGSFELDEDGFTIKDLRPEEEL